MAEIASATGCNCCGHGRSGPVVPPAHTPVPKRFLADFHRPGNPLALRFAGGNPRFLCQYSFSEAGAAALSRRYR